MKENKRTLAFLHTAVIVICALVFLGIAAPMRAAAEDSDEFRAVWFAFYDYEPVMGATEQEFTEYIYSAYSKIRELGMNAVIAHVRSHGDAMYPSKYYPWSKYASGTQGVAPGYDPLKIMVEAAHDNNLDFHAWLNPYRVCTANTDVMNLSEDNPARKWLTDDNTENDRNVLSYGGNLYYNPSMKAVRKLIINGIKEIVKNYEVDGIHFDDYFYPDWFGSEYESVFDAPEYEAYKSKRISLGKKYKDIADWRRNNVNMLVKSIYSSVKEIDPDVEYGISPGGFLDYLTAEDRYYVDYPTWLSKEGYIDYILPQVYWSFSNVNKYPYRKTVERWVQARTCDDVKVYIGIAAYKVGTTEVKGWTGRNILKNMITAARNTGEVSGFAFFDYRDMIKSANKKYIKRLMEVF